MEEKRERKPDRRTLYTKAVIKDAFLAELKTTDYDHITVTSLCQRAEIHRSTFYIHYVDALSVFDELLDQLLTALLRGMDQAVSKADSIEDVFSHSELIYKRIMTNKSQIFLLQKGFTYSAFVDKFSSELAKKLLPLLPEDSEISRDDQFVILKSLMYSYIQLDLQCLKQHTVKELEHFNALLNNYLISPCVDRLIGNA